MARRDFYPLSEPLKTAQAASCGPELHNSPNPAISTDGKAEPLAITIGNLALDMAAARRDLLDLLLGNPRGVQLLVEQFLIGSTKSGEAGAVQDRFFVQPESATLLLELYHETGGELPTKKQEFHNRLKQVHFFPASLLAVADRLLVSTPQTETIGSDYWQKLAMYKRRLYDSRQSLVSANTGLVAFVAHKQKTLSLCLDDLMQEGTLGLIRAVDRFDPNRGVCFSTYAIFWIRQAISRLIIKQEKTVRLPVALAEKASAVFEAMRDCYLEHNRWPSLTTLQSQCDLSMDDIKAVSGYYQAVHSLDSSLSAENDDYSLMDTLKQRQFSLPLNELIDKNLCLYIGKAVTTLSEKEATIITMRYGLKNHTEMTLQAIADELHLTRERVRQIQNQALHKLKNQFGNDLQPFLEPDDC